MRERTRFSYRTIIAYETLRKMALCDSYSMKLVTGKGKITDKDLRVHNFIEARIKNLYNASIKQEFTDEEIKNCIIPDCFKDNNFRVQIIDEMHRGVETFKGYRKAKQERILNHLYEVNSKVA